MADGAQRPARGDARAGDDYWRSRAAAAGIATKGVLANAPGGPGIAPLGDAAAEQATSPDAPVRLARHQLSSDVAHLVRHVWIPRWHLPPGIVVEQGVLDYPSANLVVEESTAALYGPEIGRSTQRLEGEGEAFGVLLQPGVARLLVRGRMSALIGSAIPLDELRTVDADASAEFAVRVREAVAAGDDAGAITVLERWLRAQRLELGADAGLLRRIVELAETDRGILRVDQLADAAGLGTRALQRLVHEQLGLTPKWLIGRYRMQEAAQALATSDPPPLAVLAADLGFADQAHFSRQFRAVIGQTPRRYAGSAASVA